MHHHSQRGFTLVEMAIVILILGLIVGSVFAYLDVQNQEKQVQVTRIRQQKIVAALAQFAQIHDRLPCPGLANDANLGRPVNYVATTVPFGACTVVTERNGIVPFLALGLTRNDVTDGYGNPFTFAVSTVAARQQTSPQIHRNCRIGNASVASTNDWVPKATANRDADKATFCCPLTSGTSQMRIYSNAAQTTRVLVNTPTTTPTGDFDTSADTVATGQPAASLAYEAFILISHGENGLGAWRFGDAARSSTATIGTNEGRNTDNDRDFVDLPRNTAAGNDYFDDIVVWRTQEGLIGEFGNDSCARP